jgi:protein-S-isoprenylcysteine O-methyltransferase Ste14
VLLGKIVWLLGVVVWGAIRYPHYRRARRMTTVARPGRARERLLLGVCFAGSFLVPALFLAFNWPAFARYQPWPLQVPAGMLLLAVASWVFYRTHKDLGRNFSPKLEIRDVHALVTTGIYRHLRHPMYSAFWLCGIAQTMLLANWVAGLAGLLGFGILYFIRVGHEERMLLDQFGDAYRDYMARTNRVIPRMCGPRHDGHPPIGIATQ